MNVDIFFPVQMTSCSICQQMARCCQKWQVQGYCGPNCRDCKIVDDSVKDSLTLIADYEQKISSAAFNSYFLTLAARDKSPSVITTTVGSNRFAVYDLSYLQGKVSKAEEERAQKSRFSVLLHHGRVYRLLTK